MSDYKLIPVELIRRTAYVLERFANDTLDGRNLAHELRELLSVKPDIQGRPEARVTTDYSQIELRIMAHLSSDKRLLNAFEERLDVHKATAAEVFGMTLENVTDNMRLSAKAANFRLIYDISAFGLAKHQAYRKRAKP